MSKQKILYLITKSNWGGAQTYVYDLVTNLGADYEPLVAFGGIDKPGSATGLLKDKLDPKQIPTLYLPDLGRDFFILKDIKSFITIWRLIKMKQPDIVHLNSSKVAGLGALACRLLKIKTIYTVHGWPFKEKRFWLIKLFIYLLSWLTGLLATKIIVLNQSDLKSTSYLFGLKSKTNLIYNGLGPIDFLPKTEARRILNQKAQTIIKEEEKVGLTIAELTPNKSLTVLIKALALIDRPFKYFIIGNGEEKTKLARLINDLNLNHKIILTGFIPEASRLLPACDFFVLPSRKEGFPYVLLEAGQANLPIIASRIDGIIDLISNHKNGLLVSPNDPQDLHSAINYIITNPDIGLRLAKQLKSEIDNSFTLKTEIANTLNLYQTLN